MTKTVSAEEFAANVDAFLDDVVERNEEIIITRGGRAVARVIRIDDAHVEK